METFFTTLLCVVEIWGWDDRSEAIKWGLTGCYGPYLLICESLVSRLSSHVLDADVDGSCVVICGHVRTGQGGACVAKAAPGKSKGAVN